MAITQTQAQFEEVGRKVAIPAERAASIRTVANAASVTNVAGLRLVVVRLGYPTERADHLVSAGATFA